MKEKFKKFIQSVLIEFLFFSIPITTAYVFLTIINYYKAFPWNFYIGFELLVLGISAVVTFLDVFGND